MKLTLQILCNKCKTTIKEDDLVTIDIINTLCHQFCDDTPGIKDRGTYKEIAGKYPYFYTEMYH
ncbi:hypothetical protein [Peribacillus loiseleuriae]|uniref:hypothetical protein n=1 Tax=Peribacillus loiseleuriae TaxID=1679170 RepID=UPI003D05290C